MTPIDNIIKDKLVYYPETGEIWWKPGALKNRPNGQRASRTHGRYIRIRLTHDGRRHSLLAHRVAWFLMTGGWPKECVDHINRDGHDNRWVNLREATWQQNCLNRVWLRQVTRDLPRGVKYRPRHSKRPYEASLVVKGQYLYLGCYETAEAAEEAYLIAYDSHNGLEWRPHA